MMGEDVKKGGFGMKRMRRGIGLLNLVYTLARCSATLLGILLLTGCGGGGGGDNTPAPPAPTTGTASGKLIVPPNNTVEVEPNDVITQAQAVSDSLTVSGHATQTDPGFTLPGTNGVKIEDLYSLSASGRVRITLSIAADDLNTTDLDLFLMDSSGNLLDASDGFVSTEFLETSGAGNFLVGVRAFQGSSAYVINFASLGSLAGAQSEILPPGAEFVPGDILVKLKESEAGTRQKASGFAAKHGLALKQSFPQNIDLMQVSTPPVVQKGKISPSSKLNVLKSDENALKALTLDTIQRLRKDPDIEYAEANFIRRPSRVPNDEYYPLQWHYPLMNLPQAWDVTTGSSSVIVAVIDTGVLFNHPDLSTRLIPGYDFVSDPVRARDGNGIDPDATDVGDDPDGESSSFHGTHVAGTIGAATNNTTGVAGVTWETRIMPLRVLGAGGGPDADIAQAIRYAAGLSNNSGGVPVERAHIINMSLGGFGFSQTLQDAITAARAQGVIVVAAAGNDNSSALFSPAGLEGVITVSAVGPNLTKAPYSNYGTKNDVAAPGGDQSVHSSSGILSTLGNDAGRFDYRFLQGTSMASPHVAGVLALMLAVNPKLTPADIDQLLAGTHPNTTLRITRDIGTSGRDDLYGHGLLDASQAVIAAKAIPGGSGATPTGSILGVSTSSLDFSNFISALPIDVTNAGIGTLNITHVTEDASWLIVTPSSGAAPLTVNATVDRSGLAAGAYSATINLASAAEQGSQTATVSIRMTVGGATMGNVGTVFILVVDQNTLDTVQQVEATVDQNYSFKTPEVPPGTYFIVAGTDRDNDNVICDIEDACGSYPDIITITAGQDKPNISFMVGELVSPQSATSEIQKLQEMKWRRK